ncbi:MAG: HEAT repeat domain-containing protein [Candidatus Sericytochromatia bacterium]|nr:HEAT repeat domain-containing protein [Candidatus Sericytochromatia bacterium]
MTRFESLKAELERAWSNDKAIRLLMQLVQTDAEQAIEVLSQYLYQGEPELRLAALELLVDLGRKQIGDIPELFFTILQDPLSWELRPPILKALLFQLPGQRAARDNLLKLLQSQDWDLVAHIIQALGPLADPELQSWLVESLNHPHYFVRKRAVEALGAQPWSAEVENHLLSMLSDAQSAVVLKVLQTLSNSASYRVMNQLRDLLGLPQTPSELQPVLLETAETIQNNLNQLLSRAVEALKSSEIEALAAWLAEEPDEDMRKRLEQHLLLGLNQIYRFGRPEQVHLIQVFLSIAPAQAKALYLAVLRWGLKLQCLELPESAPLEVKHLLEQMLLDQAAPDRPASEQEQAFQLLARYGTPTALERLEDFLKSPPELFMQLLPLFSRLAEQALPHFLHLSLRELEPREWENMLLFLEGFAQTGSLPVALRLLKQAKTAPLRKRLTLHLLSFGNLLGPLLLKELERSQAPEFIREVLELLLQIDPWEESFSLLVGFLAHPSQDLQERAALGLVRLNSGSEALWRLATQDESQAQAWALEILSQRGERVLTELLQLAVARSTQALWRQLVSTVLQSAQGTWEPPAWESVPVENRRQFLLCLQTLPTPAKPLWGLWLLTDPLLNEQIETWLALQGSSLIGPLLNWAEALPEREKQVVQLLARLNAGDLLQALKDCKHVMARVLLIRALLQSGVPEGQGYLWELLPVSPRPVQLVLLESLGQAQYAQTPWQPLLPFLQEPDPELQLAALRVLVRAGQQEAASAVATLLQSDLPALVLAAVEALGSLRAVAWAPALETRLLEAEANQNQALRQACLLALGQMGAQNAFQTLSKRLQIQASAEHNLPVLSALGALHHADVVAPLIAFFEGVEALEQRQKALEALCQSQQTPALNYVLGHLAEWPLPLQRTALQSLAQTGEAWILPTFERLLQQAEDWRLKRTIIEVLYYFPRMEAMHLLKQFQLAHPALPTVAGWILQEAIRETISRLRASVVSET